MADRDAPLPTGAYQLKDHASWPLWFIQLQFHALSKNLWDMIDPDGRDAPNPMDSAPEMPTLRAITAENPLEKANAQYQTDIAEYRARSSDWASRATRLQTIWNWVNATVAPELLGPAMMQLVSENRSTLQALVRALKQELAPTDASTKNLVRAEYRAHLTKAKHGTMTPEAWYQQWHFLYTKARTYKILDVEGQLAAQDFLDALAPKLAPDWARSMHQRVIEASALGKEPPTIQEIGKIFSTMLQEHSLRASNRGTGIFATLGGRSDNNSARSVSARSGHPCPCRAPGQSLHPWKAADCRDLTSAVTGKPKKLSETARQKILERLEWAQHKEVKAVLLKRGYVIPDAASPAPKAIEGSDKPAFPGSIVAALIDPALLVKPGMHATMDFDAHPLSMSTILDNGSATHLVNSIELLVPGSFRKAQGLHTVEAGTQSFPIQGTGTRKLGGVLNGAQGERTEDLTLQEVVVVEGFHVNIISEARLREKGLWYLGLDCTLRIGTLEKNRVLATLRREHNLTFVEYKAVSFYPLVQSVLPDRRRSWTTFPRSDSEELWHARAGHLGPKALRALVKSARNVRITGTERVRCEHCATTHAKQVISRRPKERAPRPFWRIAWDMFDMPLGRSGALWMMIVKDEYSGKIFSYSLQAKTLSEIQRVMENFKSMVSNQYKLRISKIQQDNDAATLPWHGKSRYELWAEESGIDIESSPPYTHEPNGAAERAGQEIITKSIKMRSSAGLPEKLWPEVVDAATWLYNMSPSHAHNLRSPNEVLDAWFTNYFRYYEPEQVRSATADLRPDWSGIYAYGCRAYPLNRERAAGRQKRSFKVTPRGHIGYLVGYRASNIYRIWVPSLDQVITTRNVAFDETRFHEDGGDKPIPREEASKIVEILNEQGEIRDAGEAFELLPQRSDEQQSNIPNQRPQERELGGAETEELVGTRVGQPEDQHSEVEATARVTSTTSKSPRIRAVPDERMALITPEPTPEPELADSSTTRPIQGRHEHTGDPRQVHLTGEADPPGSLSQTADSPVEKSTPASRAGTSSSVAPVEAGEAPPKRAYNKKSWGPATRISRRIRRQDPDDPGEPGGAGSGGIYTTLSERSSIRLAPVDPEHLQINFLGAFIAHNDRALKTLHAVFSAAAFFRQPRPRAHELPKEPSKWRDLHKHPYGDLFKIAAQKEIATLLEKGTWKEIMRSEATSKPLPLKWVFTYKFDQDGYFAKCKARICVRGDLQSKDSLQSTYAATLAARSFRTAIAIAAQFDLEIRQYDVIGAFLNAHREGKPEVTCELPEGFTKPGMCVKLLRALYGLRDSPILWYQELSQALQKLNLISSKEEPCLFFDRDRRILLLFYVDDILHIYHRDDELEAHRLISAIKEMYELEDRGPCEWFLGIKMIRNRKARTIQLVHDAYIEKVAKKFNLAESALFPGTPLPSEELTSNQGSATKQEIKEYQERVGSTLYTAIMVRPDVAFAASQLSHYLTNPGKQHFQAVNRAIVYLYRTRHTGIQYGALEGAQLIMCGDASFADHAETRRSSHGYIISLFGGPILWKAALQPTVTTSTTEAELLALAHIAKESLALKRFFKELTLELGTPWQIYCDNQQTIRLVVEENARITTCLRHVDIQNMWLRQEHAKGSFEVRYIKTSDMLADGLTKHLPRQQFEHFKQLLNLKDTRTSF